MAEIKNVKLGNTQVDKIYLGENLVWDYVKPDIIAPITTINPNPSLTYDEGQSFSFEVNEAGSTYYTLDGTTPTTNSTLFTNPFTLNETTTIKYFSVDLAGNNESVKTNTINIVSAPKGFRYIRQWMNGGIIGATPTNLNSILEFQAIRTGGTNVLLTKPNLEGWVGKLGGTSNPPSTMTDGDTTTWNYCVWSDSTASRTPQKVTFDMGALYTDLTTIKTWHNYASTGRYYNFKIQVCATNSPNDADWTTVVDAMNNQTAKTYQETSAGLTFNMP